MTAHWGPYDKLSGAYDAIKDWAAKNGHVLDRKAWEVYGHWTDDPGQLRTDVYWLAKLNGTMMKRWTLLLLLLTLLGVLALPRAGRACPS